MEFRSRVALTIIASALAVPAACHAAGWNMAFNQGIAEYSVGSFASGGSSLALSCDESGAAPDAVEVHIRRANFKPKMHEPVIFTVGKQQLTMYADADGTVAYRSAAVAPRFRALWQMLRTGHSVRIRFGPGEPLSFPLAGAAKLLGPVPCPKQLAN